MNDLFSLSSKVLELVVEQKVSFNLAVNNETKDLKISKNEKNIISSLVGCSLRHYYIFNYLINTYLKPKDNQIKYHSFIYLANNLFVNKIVDGGSYYKRFIATHDVNLDDFNDFLSKTKDKTNLIPIEYEKGSIEFLSYRFNTPSWVIKMWKKHFNDNLTYRILKGNSKSKKKVYCLNKKLITEEELLEKYPDFHKTSFTNLYSYDGTNNIKSLSLYRENYLFSSSASSQLIIEKTDIDPLRGVAIYSGYSNHFFIDLIANFNFFNNKIELMVGDNPTYLHAKNLIQKLNIDNVSLYECKPSSMITCLSSKVHTLFVFPENSNFAMLRDYPDYFFKVENINLDELIEKQSIALDESAPFVEDGGELIYAVPTINIKESRMIIKKFLSSHNDFELIMDKQLFPFDKYDSTLFFAILRKKDNND